MKKTFPGYFSNDPDALKDIWERCLFVLDANVLLSLYRYSNETRSELFEIFGLLNERLWVPHQVVSEYLVNRVGVINQQIKTYGDAIKNVEDLRQSFENPKQHPFVREETLVHAVSSFERVIADLSENKKAYLSKIESDDVKSELAVLLDGRVGAELTPDEVANVLELGPARYLQKAPPGYKDAKKGGDSEVVSDMLKPYGDYIVWKQTLAKAKEKNLPVVFVTGDSKEDWWTLYSGKPIEPHPQLVEEFLKEVGQGFFMYLPEKFMERANSYLNRVTSQSAVDEIVDVRAEDLADSVALKKSTHNSNYLLGTAFQVEDGLSPNTELETVESHMHSLQLTLEIVEFRVSQITDKLQDLMVRHEGSLSTTKGKETPHSLRLSANIGQLSIELEQAKSELELLRREYQKHSVRAANLRWVLKTVDHIYPKGLLDI